MAIVENVTEEVVTGERMTTTDVSAASGQNNIISRIRDASIGFFRGIKALDFRQWRKIALILAGFAAVTIGFTYLSRIFLAHINLPLDKYATICYLTVFLTFLIANLLLFTPLPIAITILLTASLMWNPALVGLAAAAGASIGELSGYFAGRLGRNIFVRENFMCSLNERLCNSRLSNDVERYGPLAIGILAAQPVLPFDVGGMIAGSS